MASEGHIRGKQCTLAGSQTLVAMARAPCTHILPHCRGDALLSGQWIVLSVKRPALFSLLVVSAVNPSVNFILK